ncbi:MAG: hypothetical protein ACTSPB_02110 [Candidatus Thorarchaeota archaeon]
MRCAEYKDFEDCVKKNKDKKNPEGYCAEIKRKVEGSNERELIELGAKVTDSNLNNGLAELKLTVLTEGTWNKIYYSHEELKRSLDLWKERYPGDTIKNTMVLTKNHGKSIDDVVGYVETPQEYSDGLKTRAFVHDPHIIGLMQRGYVPDVSMELRAQTLPNKELKRLEATEIEHVRASLVLSGACDGRTCTVEPVKLTDLAGELYELATACERRYMIGTTPSGAKNAQRFKRGFPGCVEAMRKCRGLDKEHAEKMCNYIFWRRHSSEEEIFELLDDYEKSEDKNKFIENLEKEMNYGEKKMEEEEKKFETNEEVKGTTESKEEKKDVKENKQESTDGGEEANVENETSCKHIAMIAERDERIAALTKEIDAIKKPLVEKICKLDKSLKEEKLMELDVETLVTLSSINTEKRPALRHTTIGDDTPKKERGRTVLF